jgi:RAB protein geranylgeranyltransferase component A
MNANPGKLNKIPSGREDVFTDQTLSREAKRSLMKFLRFVADYDDKPEIWEPYTGKAFLDFVVNEFKVPPELHDALVALTLATSPPSMVTTEFALPRIARHLRSIGIFGPGFGSVLPKFGGLAEITQVGCRAGAVGGATYILGTGLENIGDVYASSLIEEIPASDRPARKVSEVIAARLKDGVTVKTQWIVGSVDDLPSDVEATSISTSQSANNKTSTTHKSISVVSSSMEMLFPRAVEGSPPPAGAVIIFPAESISEPETNVKNVYPVHVFAHNSLSGECPDGQSILYASTSATDENGTKLLDAALASLLASVNEQPAPHVLWSMQYNQHASQPSSSPSTSSLREAAAPTASETGPMRPQHVIKFPSLSTDLAFDDTVLKEVRQAWLMIMGRDAVGFMEFEDREDMGEVYGQDEDDI